MLIRSFLLNALKDYRHIEGERARLSRFTGEIVMTDWRQDACGRKGCDMSTCMAQRLDSASPYSLARRYTASDQTATGIPTGMCVQVQYCTAAPASTVL